MNGPCSGGACVTCSDEAVPVRVLALLPGGLALVGGLAAGAQNTGGVDAGAEDTGCVDTGARDTGVRVGTEEVSVALVEARVGATVLVHAGEAIAVIGDAG